MRLRTLTIALAVTVLLATAHIASCAHSGGLNKHQHTRKHTKSVEHTHDAATDSTTTGTQGNDQQSEIDTLKSAYQLLCAAQNIPSTTANQPTQASTSTSTSTSGSTSTTTSTSGSTSTSSPSSSSQNSNSAQEFFTVLSNTKILQLYGKLIQNEWSLETIMLSEYSSDLIYAAIGWILLLAVAGIALIASCIGIFCVQRQKQTYSPTVKAGIAALLIASGFFVVYFSCVAVGTDQSTLHTTAQNVDCALLTASLAVLQNYPQQQPNWAGLIALQTEIQQVQKFFDTDIQNSPVNALATLQSTVQQAQTLAKQASQQISALSQLSTLKLTNPNADDAATTPQVSSTFLQGFSTTNTASIQKDYGDPSSTLETLQNIQTTFNDLSTNSQTYQGEINQASATVARLVKALSTQVIVVHNSIQSAAVQSTTYYKMYYAYFYVCIGIVIIGLTGYFTVILSQYRKVGLLLHATWMIGFVFLIGGAALLLAIFYTGVGIQQGACQPTQIILTQQTITDQFLQSYVQNKYPSVQSVIDSCFYSQNGNIASAIFSTLNANELSTLAKEMNQFVSGLPPLQTTTLASLEQTAAQYASGAYPPTIAFDTAIGASSTSNEADSAATTLTSWTNYKATASNQAKQSSAGNNCQVTQDTFAFTSAGCQGSPVWQASQGETYNTGSPLCFVLSPGLPATLAQDRYLASKFTGCTAVTNKNYQTIQGAAQYYYKQLYTYLQSVETTFTQVDSQLKNLEASIQSLSQNLQSAASTVKAATPNVQNDLSTPMQDLLAQSQCSWVPALLAQVSEAPCTSVLNVLYDNYLWFAYTTVALSVFVAVSTIAAILFYSRFRNVTYYSRNDLDRELRASKVLSGNQFQSVQVQQQSFSSPNKSERL